MRTPKYGISRIDMMDALKAVGVNTTVTFAMKADDMFILYMNKVKNTGVAPEDLPKFVVKKEKKVKKVTAESCPA